MYSSTILSALLAGLAAAAPTMEERAATFAATTTWEFTGTTLPTGLAASDYHVGTSGAPLSHTFKSSNVVVADGALKLVVPGGQEGQSDISSAEVATTFKTLYGSIKVEAIMTEVGGVCNGTHETPNIQANIRMLTLPRSLLLPIRSARV